jgi:nuclear transport factor 2 (NTF2) superfamily protein/nicotinamidase-related amidase
MQRQPVPPFTRETALAKVHAAEDAWNTRDPQKVAQAYTPDSRWRNRDEFLAGREAIVEFLTRKWKKELHYRLMKELWAYTENRISVRFEYEWQHARTGQWYRTHGNEHWEFDDDGYMRRRDMSANDVPIGANDRRIGAKQESNQPEDDKMSSTATKTRMTYLVAVVAAMGLGGITKAELPDPGVTIEPGRTALLITDPQNDFLHPEGVAWGVVGKSVTENNTVENIDSLFKSAKANDIPVFISPHYYYPTDHGWQFEGALEALMHAIGMFDREGALTTEGFEDSGADFLERYKKYINDGETVVSNPHKVYGPETNDLVLQLRKRGIDKVILGGMSANLCTESHMRELIEQGFEVAIVSDATAAAIVEEGNGYEAALVNFRYIANTVWTTAEAVQRIEDAH